MHPNHPEFITALTGKKKVMLTFFSKEDGTHLRRTCAPMDFGPSRRAKDQSDRYHFWDYDSDTQRHVLSLLPNQVVTIEIIDESFDPGEFITWSPISWFMPRNWEQYS
jgi:hypothetical protein